MDNELLLLPLLLLLFLRLLQPAMGAKACSLAAHLASLPACRNNTSR
jgi:hypothetical protein